MALHPGQDVPEISWCPQVSIAQSCFSSFFVTLTDSGHEGHETISSPSRNFVVYTTIKPNFLFPGYPVCSLRFIIIRDRNDLQTDISSSLMPSWAFPRIALAMVAHCFAVSRAIGVGVTSFCLL